MPPFNPIQAVATIWGREIEDSPVFLGSCFAFRSQRAFLTAAHCVGDVKSSQLAVVNVGENRKVIWRPVSNVERHPSADIAVIRTLPMTDAEREVIGERESSTEDRTEPFWRHVSNYGIGEDFHAFGFPENIFGDEQRAPTPRLFKGHFQRFMEYESRHLPYQYFAAEMSIPAPAGLSGGPLFRPGAPPMVTALVTENLQSTTFLDQIETIVSGNATHVTKYEQVISYGVALMLDRVADWLDDHAPDERRANGGAT
jgi:Trypsin-like peptidase domain